MDKWPAKRKWTRKYLRKAFKGKRIVAGNYDMRFSDYRAYVRQSRDDMPLYLFDKEFVKKAPHLADDYQVSD